MAKFFRDLFKGPNGNWDFGRFAAFHSLSLYSVSFLYALFYLKKVPDWSNLGIGYAAVMGGAGMLIGIKDIAVAKADVVTLQGGDK